MSIADNLKYIEERIAAAAERSGRRREDITLIAVSKKVEPARICEAAACGVTDIGENYAQELTAKLPELPQELRKHYIGHLQSNKVKLLVGRVETIQSVDSERLAAEIERRAAALGVRQRVLVEVNLGSELRQSGVAAEQAPERVERIAAYPHVEAAGLMAIPPQCDSESEARRYFERLHRIYVDIKNKKIDNTNICLLSMGMSADFEAAIAEGSNMVRIGTAIFGSRT